MFRHKATIYNSRNYSILLNLTKELETEKSTTVEIILYYLTLIYWMGWTISTTVEIILYYLTVLQRRLHGHASTTVEIILYYLTIA